MTDRELLQQALDALENSVDTVQHEYDADWRHGLPTRKAQLDGMKECLDAHIAAITSLRERLAQPEQEPDPIGDAQDRLIAELAAQPEQEPVPENFMDALKFDVAARDAREWDALYNTPPAAQRT